MAMLAMLTIERFNMPQHVSTTNFTLRRKHMIAYVHSQQCTTKLFWHGATDIFRPCKFHTCDKMQMSKMSKGTLWIHVMLGSRKWCRLVSVLGPCWGLHRAKLRCPTAMPKSHNGSASRKFSASWSRKHHALNTLHCGEMV
jgi:hypothetical protein